MGVMMDKAKAKYNFINLGTMLIAAMLFILNYRNVQAFFHGKDIWYILTIIAAAFVVHLVKGSRLYLALYGSDIGVSAYLKMYCKVTPVSVIFPYKLGEFFRMYGYGHSIRNPLKGIVIVILDRFMDTAALVAIMLLVKILNGGRAITMVYILLIFLGFVSLIYFAFPRVYEFWIKYLLRAKATEQTLSLLKMLDALNIVYREMANVSQGRGLILYVLSLVAWAVEIGGLALLNGISSEGELNQAIVAYLSAAMGTGISVELKSFVFVSVVLLVAIYAAIVGTETVFRKKVHQ